MVVKMAIFHEIFVKNHCKIRTMEIPKMMRWHFQWAAYCRGNVCITWICHSFVGFCEHVSGVKKYRPNKKHICKILLKNERPTTLRRIGSKLSGKYQFYWRFYKLLLVTLLLLSSAFIMATYVWIRRMK